MMAVLAVKLKNELKKHADNDMNLFFSLRNILINGDKRGCSGFVRNAATGSVVYITTETPVLSGLGYMYRYADNEEDYRGYRNRWAESMPELVREVCRMLKKTPQEDGDVRI